jgi:hypothetical protein
MFTSIHKKLNSYVMGSISSLIRAKEAAQPVAQLSASEIEFLLILIKNSNFKGKTLETVYGTVVKLQQQYIALQNQQE